MMEVVYFTFLILTQNCENLEEEKKILIPWIVTRLTPC